MLRTLSLLFGLIPCILRSRRSLLLEVLALRQQLAVLKAKHPQPRRQRRGRRPTPRLVRDLIFCMVAENQTWGAPRIHGELRMLGFDISERSVLRWMRKAPRPPEPAKRWSVFLSNHREAIAAMDFFTVPTLTFGMIHCFFVISHDAAAFCIAT